MIQEKIKDSFVDKQKIEFRKYQKDIASKCVGKNSLVVIPTGLGKTIIAILVAAETLKLYPEGTKIIMLAPTRPLINQHYNSFTNFFQIPKKNFCILTGMVHPEKRKELFQTHQFIFYTPQTLRNDLIKEKYSLENVCLIIFDEVHHASGDYPYEMIANKYVSDNHDGNILGLTASPGASKNKINDLCELMSIPLENTHFRTRKDSDVKQYVKPMDIFKISVEKTKLMEDIYNILKALTEERLQYLALHGHLDEQGRELFKKIIRKNLIELNRYLIDIIKGQGDKTGVYSAVSINAQALILYHMIELIEQQGLDNLLEYLEKMYKDALKKKNFRSMYRKKMSPEIVYYFFEPL